MYDSMFIYIVVLLSNISKQNKQEKQNICSMQKVKIILKNHKKKFIWGLLVKHTIWIQKTFLKIRKKGYNIKILAQTFIIQ